MASDRLTTIIEGVLRRGLSDADPTARKHTRRSAALRPFSFHGVKCDWLTFLNG